MAGLLEWTQTWVMGAGPWGLFTLAFAESSFFPIPPDVLLILMVLAVPQEAFWLAAVTTAGSVLGACAGYALGRWGGRPLLDRFVPPDRVRAVERAFQRYDAWAVGIAGFTPVPYKVFTVAAGAFNLHFGRFAVVSVLARGGRFFLVSALIFEYGQTAQELMGRYFNVFSIVFILLLAGGFWAVKYFGSRAVDRKGRL